MRTIIMLLSLLVLPVMAGGINVAVSDASTNPEAQRQHAVMVARITACLALDKTVLTATAEGIVDGKRTSLPLKLIPLSEAGVFAIVREWPQNGVWAVKIVGTYPEHKNYAMGMLVPFDKDRPRTAAVQRFGHLPKDTEVVASIN